MLWINQSAIQSSDLPLGLTRKQIFGLGDVLKSLLVGYGRSWRSHPLTGDLVIENRLFLVHIGSLDENRNFFESVESIGLVVLEKSTEDLRQMRVEVRSHILVQVDLLLELRLDSF